MANDERIKKKLGKLLTKWSVPDAEKVEFLKELEEEIAKPDEEEDLEGVAEETEEVKEESPNEEVGEEEVEEQEVSEDAEEPAETEPAEEPVEEPLPEEPVAEEPVAEEQPGEELPPVEQPPVEENPMEQPMEQPQPTDDPRFEEMSNTIQGLTDRLASLEDIVKKLGTPVEENIGVEPHNPSGESLQESELDRYNKLRMGR